ncbi:MAG: efflux RND transporter periplasmic adaptor subunit [Deltaproteobacteria bacterium]|nr:efflux RND transporter periplasmic adaptor subunit [Deltaproteobacteria bacterium]
MTRTRLLFVVLALMAPALLVLAGCRDQPAAHRSGEVWTCPMHPAVRQDHPGSCPICKMDLVKVDDRMPDDGALALDARQRALAGVRTTTVTRGRLATSIKAPGRVVFDETRLRDLSPRVGGWVVDVTVDQVGMVVQAGQVLFTLSAPELVAAQAEHLRAVAGSDEGLARASAGRLGTLGLTPAQVEELVRRGAPFDPAPILAPVSGVVVDKGVVPGARVEAGMRLLRLAQLDRLWVEADVFTADVGEVRVGQSALIAVNGAHHEGKVARVLPNVEGGARTARVRVDLANRGAALRPGMVVEVEIVLGSIDALLVPASAVLYTGPRRVVFVQTPDPSMAGGFRFVPRTVQLGRRGGEQVEIVSGLDAGDAVVVDGAFLLASESRLRWPGALDAPAADAGMLIDGGAP